MTNHQRAFQRELNRLQKSISNLQKKGYIQNVDLPDIPKRVTTKAIEELKLQRGKNYVVKTPTIETPSSKGSKAFVSNSSRTYIHKPRESQTQDELNAKRREWYASNRENILNKKAQWRDANRDKVRESSKKSYQKHRDEILAKQRDKRKQAREDKEKPTAPRDTYYPKETPIENVSRETSKGDGQYDMIEWILAQINFYYSDVVTHQPEHSWVGQIPRGVRLEHLSSLRTEVETNRDNAGYYDTLSNRQDEISDNLFTISWDSKEERVENSWSFLGMLFSPTGYMDTETAKKISEEGEAYNNENYEA